MLLHNTLFIWLEISGSNKATAAMLASECSQQEMFNVATLHGEFLHYFLTLLLGRVLSKFHSDLMHTE